MKVYRDTEKLPVFRNAIVTIGTFDGVHLGHQQIIRQLNQEATSSGGESLIITFHPHPRKVIKGKESVVSLLNTLDEKIELLDQHGVDNLVVVPFTEAFSKLTAEEYIRLFLVEKFHPHTLIIGYDHRFGNNRQGNYQLLEEYAPLLHYQVKEIPEHLINEVTISSTRIRESLLQGDIALANSCLAYPYFFEAIVVHGDKRGRTIGYPTANLQIDDPEKLVPGNGVYAVEVNVTVNGSISLLSGMMNIGIRPTVDGTRRMIEVHIFDFNKDIYGKEIRVYLKAFLRSEQKFNSIDELKAQLASDEVAARRELGL